MKLGTGQSKSCLFLDGRALPTSQASVHKTGHSLEVTDIWCSASAYKTLPHPLAFLLTDELRNVLRATVCMTRMKL